VSKNKNRFAHLKNNKSENSLPTKEEFIAAPLKEYDDILDKKETTDNEKANQDTILLAVSGRINREKDCGKGRLIYIRSDVERDIKKYCRGNKTLIINYLLRRGIEILIEKNECIIHCEDH